MKKLLRFLLALLLILVLAVGGLLGWLTVTEFNPDPVEPLTVRGASEPLPALPGERLSLLSWNIGYAGLGAESDFFMDGGENSMSADRDTVRRYLAGITETLENGDYDVVMLQEVDLNSTRSYSIDETAPLLRANGVHALNYSCPFVPIPVPPIGKVNSGLFTTSDYAIEYAERIALPCPFSWPLRIANLKRCLLVSYFPIEGTDRQLVLVNLHLEAYDDGEGKIAQTNQLRSFIREEYEKGNYVIAGGDFNQTFPGGLERYPILDPTLWTPGVLDDSLLPEGWRFAYDMETPSCRLLNQPYNPENTQHFVIDGYILSPNIALESVETLDLGFANADHNPVALRVRLLEEAA